MKNKDLYQPLLVDVIVTCPGTQQEVVGRVSVPMTEDVILKDYEISQKVLREDLLMMAEREVKVRLCKGEVSRVIRAIKARRRYVKKK